MGSGKSNHGFIINHHLFALFWYLTVIFSICSYETSNGVTREEAGTLKDVPDEENKLHSVVVVRGSYQFPGEDGKLVSINYYADETGYHAEGDSIPKPASRR